MSMIYNQTYIGLEFDHFEFDKFRILGWLWLFTTCCFFCFLCPYSAIHWLKHRFFTVILCSCFLQRLLFIFYVLSPSMTSMFMAHMIAFLWLLYCLLSLFCHPITKARSIRLLISMYPLSDKFSRPSFLITYYWTFNSCLQTSSRRERMVIIKKNKWKPVVSKKNKWMIVIKTEWMLVIK